jgi:methyl-accepting chemotaxis protein
MVTTTTLVIVATEMYTKMEDDIKSYREASYADVKKELKGNITLAKKTLQSFANRCNIDNLRKDVKEDLKDHMDFLVNVLNNVYNTNKDTMDKNELKQRLLNIVKNTRHSDGNYFWIQDVDVNMVMHPIKESLNGLDLSNKRDGGGKLHFKKMSNLAKIDGEGVVMYLFEDPNGSGYTEKISYVKLFEPYGWVIGTGEIVDQVTESIKQEALKTISDMRYGEGLKEYFWVNNKNNIMLSHPNSSIIGKDFSNMTDAKIADMTTKAIANGSGYTTYTFKKFSSSEPKEKMSYVEMFDDWSWVIGTGVYTDDIEKNIIKKREETQDSVMSMIIITVVSAFVVMAIIIVLAQIFIKNALAKPLEEFVNGLNQFFRYLNRETHDVELLKAKNNDEIGEMVTQVNASITQTKQNFDMDTKLIDEVKDVIEKANNGFYVYTVDAKASSSEIEELKNALNSMIINTKEKIDTISEALKAYGVSNFDYEITKGGMYGNFGTLATTTKLIGNNVSEILAMIMNSGNELSNNTDLLSSSAQKLSIASNQQAASLEETAASIEEITGTIKSTVEKAQEMAQIATSTQSSAQSGKTLAQKTAVAMEEINTSTEAINEAIAIIDQIAFQTNILSLNAAVEAATAGDAGKGFAVVAGEVRNLANRSAEAAKDIKELVIQAQEKTTEGKEISNEMMEAFSSLSEQISNTSEMVNGVANASMEQMSGMEQINSAMNDLDIATQDNAKVAGDISNLSKDVNTLAISLITASSKAKYKEVAREQVCDVELVYESARLKLDMIKAKEIVYNSLDKSNLDSYTTSELYRWIEMMAPTPLAKSQNFGKSKEIGAKIYDKLKEYHRANSANESNSNLRDIAKDVEELTIELFNSINNLKIDNCRNTYQEKTVIEDDIPRPPKSKSNPISYADSNWENF